MRLPERLTSLRNHRGPEARALLRGGPLRTAFTALQQEMWAGFKTIAALATWRPCDQNRIAHAARGPSADSAHTGSPGIAWRGTRCRRARQTQGDRVKKLPGNEAGEKIIIPTGRLAPAAQ